MCLVLKLTNQLTFLIHRNAAEEEEQKAPKPVGYIKLVRLEEHKLC